MNVAKKIKKNGLQCHEKMTAVLLICYMYCSNGRLCNASFRKDECFRNIRSEVTFISKMQSWLLFSTWKRTEKKKHETSDEHIGRVFGEVAPSMLLCSLTECVVFFLGALTDMPAVEQFALAAAIAILFDFLLQITIFLAVLSLDARRQEVNVAYS